MTNFAAWGAEKRTEPGLPHSGVRHQNLPVRNRRAVATVEMALILPIFFALIMGMIEFGRAMMVSQLVTNAARDGARTGTRPGATEGDVQAAVKTFLDESLNVSEQDLSISVSVVAGPGNPTPASLQDSTPGDKCTVRVSIPFSAIAFVPGDFLSGRSLRGYCSMRREW